MNQDLYKNKLLVLGRGYEWSAHNWSGTDEDTLHPKGDPTWNKYLEWEDTNYIVHPNNFWTEYVACSKGNASLQQESLLEFANKYGIGNYVVIDKELTEVSPTTFTNLINDVNDMVKATHQFHEMGKAPQWVIDRLNKFMNIRTKFGASGLNFEITDTQSAVWVAWYLDLMKGAIKTCEYCTNPYLGRAGSKTCSTSCRVMLSKKKKKGDK